MTADEYEAICTSPSEFTAALGWPPPYAGPDRRQRARRDSDTEKILVLEDTIVILLARIDILKAAVADIERL